MTQVSRIRSHLEAGKSITNMQAIAVYGIFRLSSCIEDLRATGLGIDMVLKRDEMGKQYGEYRLRQPIVAGSQVQVKPGHGYGLPNWVKTLRLAEVLETKDDTALVRFIRGKNREAHWLNIKELVRAN